MAGPWRAGFFIDLSASDDTVHVFSVSDGDNTLDDWLDEMLANELSWQTKPAVFSWYKDVPGEEGEETANTRTVAISSRHATYAASLTGKPVQRVLMLFELQADGWPERARAIARWWRDQTTEPIVARELESTLEDPALDDPEFARRKAQSLAQRLLADA
jgi:hypothetical protein